MSIIKKLGFWLASGLFKFTILFLALTGTIVLVFGQSNHIKKTLSDSGVYDNATSAVLDQANKSSQKSDNSNFPINDPAIQKAVKDAFTPAFLRDSSEKIIDGTYHWLDGKSTKPDFAISIWQVKKDFMNSLGDYVEKKYNELPICSKQAQKTIDITKAFDPFSATCRPTTMPSSVVRDRFIEKLDEGKFFDSTYITVDILPKDSEGKTALDKAKDAPKIYKLSKETPLLLSTGAVLFAMAVIFLASTKRKGLKNIAISLTGTGLVLTVVSSLAIYGLGKSTGSTGSIGKSLQSNSFQLSLLKAIDSFGKLFTKQLLWFGIGYLVFGVGILIVLHFTGTKDKSERENKPKTEDMSKDQPAKETPELANK